jgi:hypothetical protein
MKVRLLHDCTIPIGWNPANRVEGAEYGVRDVVDVPLSDLRVVSTGECRVLENVILQEERG